ncbi:GNAT family N-acetyltransferase [Plantactinospora endophytica]|uniref:GCN5 family N-acetyltransferase n=1 Tax=Plantactinospora endophytica TaxID=673535 RepID=A0ABQ4E6J9_9ACTN|nr:GNAT family N-acetyltransferase [Plantactinospora endophytica]GIG90308.1 GCN5 family N-acetyltransferase [Plantactinospora endophytica]
MRIRAARPRDLAGLREIERAAGRSFRDIGMPEVADDEPPSVDELTRYLHAGLAWVAVPPVGPLGDRRQPGRTDPAEVPAGHGLPVGGDVPVSADVPVGYLVAEPVDGCLHVEQVSVHPRAARRGVGRRLLDHLAEYATATGVPALTLTTFVDVPWNAPYYLRCGFVVLDEHELTPGLAVIRAREAAHGLDRWPRVCMRRDL